MLFLLPLPQEKEGGDLFFCYQYAAPPGLEFIQSGSCPKKTHSCIKTKKAAHRLMCAAFFLAPRAGLEPATLRLTVACSTIELPRNILSANIHLFLQNPNPHKHFLCVYVKVVLLTAFIFHNNFCTLILFYRKDGLCIKRNH